MHNSIEQNVRAYIKEHGEMPLDTFMETCLYHPTMGYYMKKDPFGTEGDFTTAPEISQLFGEILAAWIADSWIKMGKPQPWILTECGAGRGTLMADILRTLKKVLPEAYSSVHVNIIEISPHLKEMQQRTLESHSNITWHTSLEKSTNHAPIILIANELLDAFPIKQYSTEAGGIKERTVKLDNDDKLALAWSQKSHNITSAPALAWEESPAAAAFLKTVTSHIKDGIALFIDYGDDRPNKDSLQALYKHTKVSPLTHLGEADITAHVNFSQVRGALGADNTSNTEPMGGFLTDIGLPARAAMLHQKATPEEKQQIEADVKRLIHPDDMGELFKVIGYRTSPEWDLAGLAFQPHISHT